MSETASPKKFFVGWDEFQRHCKALAWRLIENPPPGGWKGIIAITRGGLIPAGIVARELDIRIIETIGMESYHDYSTQGKISILKHPAPELVGDGAGWIVIDDLVDSGQTIAALKPLYPAAHIAVVYAKPKGRPFADSFMTEVSQDTWIYFPWDVEPTFSQPVVTIVTGKTSG